MTDRSRDGVGRSGPSPDAEPEATVDRPDRVTRRLDALRGMGRTAAGIRAKGEDAYFGDDIDGQTLRLAGRQLIVQVAAVTERLPDSFRAAHSDIAWDDVRGMRNLVAHHHDKVQDRFVWDTLGVDIPDLLHQLDLG